MQNSQKVSFSGFQALIASELMVLEANKISAQTQFRLLPNWSSLNALLLISKVNEIYGVFISSADLASLTTLEDLYELIAKNLDGVK
ncbi:MAG: acyl carrier protein [Bacteroidia bacterium]|nr:acyl carrier protein [Bacteroidia bacterium]MCF8427074.1 acyl carrier protein [Bacteroidia bacterium]MCF8446896.1 acyl carrier protein [Bacteroidia bacterium]